MNRLSLVVPFALLAMSAIACGGSGDAPEDQSAAGALTNGASAPESFACVVITQDGTNIPFRAPTTQNDREYRTYEVAESNGVNLSLKAGHGVARLEAAISGKLAAYTSYSTGRNPVPTEELQLSVLSPKNNQVAATCFEGKCNILVPSGEIPFRDAKSQAGEYATTASGEIEGVTFSQQEGHGVFRLEASTNGKPLASTFYSANRPAEPGFLALTMRASNGNMIEAQCNGVEARIN